ncbi:hypothetical protein TRFO_01459 [Tritrichomonas foetus]|uniref:Uncharacterized protein n=1 Tax=Tritrichomonas foetus TaxID=1144522 RepID=A0A1J4K2R9_9EUKA|nr:hypothetical protein TRFO_01459 [Tritrichomonas foetus]|eukprot:OHT03789.1 hypothetical protein TRFO_01459 [Tritrichomonas foetus]
MSISSDEINLLVQHYLQELGYSHAAFAFGCESKIPLNKISKRHVQPGALVYLIQKGIMFAQMEAAAEKALEEPNSLFAHQLNVLRINLRQSNDLVNELCSATRKMKVFPTQDDTQINTIYLDQQSALMLVAHQSPVLACAWHPSSEFMATASAKGNIVIWRYEICSNSTCIVHHLVNILCTKEEANQGEQDITSLDWHSTEPILAAGNFSGVVKLYNEGKEILSIQCFHSPVVSAKFSPDGSSLVAASSKGTVVIIKNNEITAKYTLKSEISDVTWIDDNSLLVAAGNTLNRIVLNAEDDKKEPENVLTAQDSIVQIAADSKLSQFAIIDAVGFLTVIDNQGNIVFTSQIHRGCICCATWGSPVVPFTVITGGCDASVKMTNIKEQRPVSFDGHISPVYSVACDSNGKYIASAAKNRINIWTMEGNRLIISYEAIHNVVSLNWSPSGRFLAICLFSGEVAVIDFDQLC